jgi:hypothetical protein
VENGMLLLSTILGQRLTISSLVGGRVRRCIDLQGTQHTTQSHWWWSSKCHRQGRSVSEL